VAINVLEYMIMDERIYESPKLETVEMCTEQAILSASLTGEGINEWEDM